MRGFGTAHAPSPDVHSRHPALRSLPTPPYCFTPIWTGPKRARADATLRAYWAAPVVYKGHGYAWSDRNAGDARLACADLATGEVRWSEHGRARTSLVRAGEKLLVFGGFGDFLVVKATPNAYTTLPKTTFTDPAIGGPLLGVLCWAAHVIARGYAYLGSADRIASIDLAP